MGDRFVIRLAEERDDLGVGRLLVRSFSHLYARMGLEMSPERHAYLTGQAERRVFASSFIYEVDGLAAGSVTLVPPSDQSKAWIDHAWEIRLLAIDPGMQRRGIGRALLSFAEQYASERGATVICLHARRGVDAQARLYLVNGYIRDPDGDMDVQPIQDGYRKDLSG